MAPPKPLAQVRELGEQALGTFAFHPLDEATDGDMRRDGEHDLDMIRRGRLYRLTLTLLADQGEDVMIQTTAFVPEPEEAEHWGDLPCLLGLYGCLERVRFAVDPRAELFYFGPAAADA
jgi:hypothetical protein